MDLNAANLNALFQSYNAAFAAGLQLSGQKVSPESASVEELAMTGVSTGAATLHAWLQQIPGMRKWVGDRIINKLAKDGVLVANEDFEASISVLRNSIEDDTYGIYTPLIQAMGSNSGALWLKLVVDALIAGVTDKWIDGKAIYALDRTYGKKGGTLANKVLAALDSTTFAAAVEAMNSYTGHEGEPLEVTPYMLLVGPKLRNTAWNLVKNQYAVAPQLNVGKTENVGAAAIMNPVQGLCDFRVSNRLVGAAANYWFLLGQSAGIKGVYVQKRKEPVLTRMDRETDANVFERNELIYGTHARGAAFLTFPHLVYAGIV